MSRPYAYASSPDVLRHLTHFQGATFTATSKPNATQVHGNLLGAADELDAKLAAAGYSAPVATGATTAFGLLTQWNSIGAAMYSAAGQPGGGDSKHLAFLERRWTTILQAIDDGDVSLPGVAKDSTLSQVRSSVMSSPSPYFNRDFQR